jgi:hypothetical protein
VGYDLLVAITFVVMTPVVIAGFIVFWIVNARDHDEVAALWRGYAKKRGLHFVEPEGEWPNLTAPTVTWSDDLAELRFTSIGREANVHTRLVVRPRSTLLGTMAMVVGDAAAGAVELRERPAGFAQRIVTEEVRRMLLGFRQRDRVTLRYQRGRITVEWPGGERNDARLDEARRLGEQLARTVDHEFRATALAAVRTTAAYQQTLK